MRLLMIRSRDSLEARAHMKRDASLGDLPGKRRDLIIIEHETQTKGERA
jgi:hypothetical protein